MHMNIVFSPLYTIYSIIFVFYFGCLCTVKCRTSLKIVSILTQLPNSEYIKCCIFGHIAACTPYIYKAQYCHTVVDHFTSIKFTYAPEKKIKV